MAPISLEARHFGRMALSCVDMCQRCWIQISIVKQMYIIIWLGSSSSTTFTLFLATFQFVWWSLIEISPNVTFILTRREYMVWVLGNASWPSGSCQGHLNVWLCLSGFYVDLVDIPYNFPQFSFKVHKLNINNQEELYCYASNNNFVVCRAISHYIDTHEVYAINNLSSLYI